MNITTSCEKKEEDIFKFENKKIWKNQEFKTFLIPEITLVGKYIINKDSKIISHKYEEEVIENNQKKKKIKSIECYMDELEDINGIKISLLTPLSLRPVVESPYQIIGKLITFPDGYSSKVKLYAQLLVYEINNVPKEAEYYSEMNKIMELRKTLLELSKNKNKQDIKWISLSLKEKGKVNFLIISSLKGYNGTKETDILNDVYGKNYKQKEMEKYFGFSTELDQNIIRVNFSNKRIVISEIKKKIEEAKKNNIIYDYLVFVKGGGENMSIFNDTEFCNNIMNLNLPFITAVGHSDDDGRLLCLLSDIDLITPTELGKRLTSVIFNLRKENENTIKESNSKKEKIFNEFDKKELEKCIKDLESKNNLLNDELNKKEKCIKSLQDKLEYFKAKNDSKIETLEKEKQNIEKKVNRRDFILTIAFVIILFLTGYVVYSNFFINAKEIKTDNSKTINTKIEKEKINNLVKPKAKLDEKTKKETTQKKLIYSEDEVFTALLWKGYKGEKAIYDFQKDNKMKQTGKVDEALLKKLGIKIRYK